MAGETWRVVPSIPAIMASSEGRIMVSPYWSEMPRGGRRAYGGEPHFGVWNKQDGRFITSFKGKTYKVHRLVCEAFNGPIPFDRAVVMHLDENAANNRPDNLAWGTQKENLNAPQHSGYRSASAKGKRVIPRDSALPKGVSLHASSGKYAAYMVGDDGRQKYLGLFRTPEEAEVVVTHHTEVRA